MARVRKHLFLCLKLARNMPLAFIVRGLFLFQTLGMFKRFNSNPEKKSVGDCTVRAMCKLFNCDWYTAYDDLCAEGRILHDMPSSNAVWGSYLYLQGFHKHLIHNRFDQIMTVRDFANRHPSGLYLLATGTHVVAVVDGDYFDSWDSGDEIPIYYYSLEE